MQQQNWKQIPREQADENINHLRMGTPTNIPQLYALPKAAEGPHRTFVKRIEERKWGFILVRGENGAGKSAYVKHIEAIAQSNDYAIVHIEVDAKQIKDHGPSGYFNLQLVTKIRLPAGEMLLYRMKRDEDFRRALHKNIENKMADLEFWSAPLAQAFWYATSEDEPEKRKMAESWLEGAPKSVSELKELGIYDRAARSVLNIPTDKLLHFLQEICTFTKAKGLFITVDEIERIGTELTPQKGRESLSILRNIINILVSEDAGPTKKGVAQGVFVCFAISTFFLGYSGIVEVPGQDFRAQVDKYGKPKTLIGDVPRLDSILRHTASSIGVEFDNLDDLINVAERIIGCYARAHDINIDMAPKELAEQSFERTSRYTARYNVQEMVRILQQKYDGGS